jgi:hypothetical protein
MCIIYVSAGGIGCAALRCAALRWREARKEKARRLFETFGLQPQMRAEAAERFLYFIPP